MKEFDLIKKFFLPLTKSSKKLSDSSNKSLFNPLNLQDDVALIKSRKNHDLIVSKDIFIENIHFLKSDGAKKIAAKLILTNLSDIASSGGKPLGYLLGFSKNPNDDYFFFKEFSQSLEKIQKKYNFSLIGGDTSNSQQSFYSITIFGEVKKDKALLRKNARDGDLIFVSNSIGEAFLGLNLKLNPPQKLCNFEKKLLAKHYYPEPRLELAQKLSKYNLSQCATDISDGLIADLSNICNASALNAKIFLSKIPFSKESETYLQKNLNFSKIDLITGGDDYELIFAVDPKNINKISKVEKELNLRLTCIGKFFKSQLNSKNKTKKFDVFLFENEENEKLQPIKLFKKGYEHK